MPRSAKRSAGPAPAASQQEKRKKRKGIILLILCCLLLIGCGALCYWFNHQLFARNPRFTLKVVEIKSNGYWGRDPKTKQELCDRIGLRVNAQNLFELSPGELLAKLKSIPNVADAQVERVLPDVIRIRIEERMPRAFIHHRDSKLVVDAGGMVMDARQCHGELKNLPFITGVPGDVTPGMQIPDVVPALELVMQINRAFPEFQLDFIDVKTPGELLFRLQEDDNEYVVVMSQQQIPPQLDELKSTIMDCRANHVPARKITLKFDGQVVVK